MGLPGGDADGDEDHCDEGEEGDGGEAVGGLVFLEYFLSFLLFEFFSEGWNRIDEDSAKGAEVSSVAGFLAGFGFSFPERSAGCAEFEPIVIAICVKPLCEFGDFTL